MLTEKNKKFEQSPKSQKLDFVKYLTKKDINLFEGGGARVIKEWMRRYNLTRDEAITLGYYFHHLNLTPEDTVNRHILDVGSGPGEFKSALQKVAGEANVVNFDDGKVWSGFMDIQGKAEHLPFRDNAFDVALAHCSVPIMQATVAKRLDLIPETLKEMFRVVKRGGGIVKIFPVGVRGFSSHLYHIQMNETVQGFLSEFHTENLDVEIKITVFADESNRGEQKENDLLEIIKP